jgi:hypothetical protein
MASLFCGAIVGLNTPKSPPFIRIFKCLPNTCQNKRPFIPVSGTVSILPESLMGNKTDISLSATRALETVVKDFGFNDGVPGPRQKVVFHNLRAPRNQEIYLKLTTDLRPQESIASSLIINSYLLFSSIFKE